MKASVLKMVSSGTGTRSTSSNQSGQTDYSGLVGAEKPVQEPAFEPVPTSQTPSNDPSIGLVYGVAPDPSSEIVTGPEPIKPPSDESGGGQWRPKVLELESAKEAIQPKYVDFDIGDDGTPSATISNMNEAEFIEFWAIDFWDALSAASLLLRFDISEIETGEDDEEQARKAAKVLYRMAKRRPKMFGWMISETTVEGADWLACVSFVGGKIAAVYAGVKERHLEKKRKVQEKAKGRTSGGQPAPVKEAPVIDGEFSHG